MHTIYHQLKINKSKDEVFKTISTINGFNNWWTLECHGNFELNEIINFNFTDEYNWFAKISKFSKNENIEFQMTDANEEWNPTSFGFELKEVNQNATSIDFYHKNWNAVSKEFRVASFCWAMLLSQLKQYLEEGIITPFEKRN